MKVSIILPIYNAEKFLHKCVESLLAQTFQDFEILAINDGSTDGSLNILKSYHDQRLKIINNEVNKGLIYTLNRGLKESQGDFIARMDADDICHPQRLEKQLQFFSEHPKVDVASTDMVLIDENDRPMFRPFIPVTDPILMKWILLRRNMLYHPTVMIRKSSFKGDELAYDPNALYAEDYDLWLRLSKAKVLVNQSEILLFYRRHGTSVTQSKLENQLLNSYKMVQKHIMESFNLNLSLATITVMNRPLSLSKEMDLSLIIFELTKLRSVFPLSTLIDINLQGFLWQLLFSAHLRGASKKDEVLKQIDLSFTMEVIKNGLKYVIRRSGIWEKLKYYLRNTGL
ncbi:MAG: glycosyltransferase family 2 protein [Bacteriovoracaceae bacterium]